MSNVPQELRYTQSHEWVLAGDDGQVTVGLADHAQELLGDRVCLGVAELGAGVVGGAGGAGVGSG